MQGESTFMDDEQLSRGLVTNIKGGRKSACMSVHRECMPHIKVVLANPIGTSKVSYCGKLQTPNIRSASSRKAFTKSCIVCRIFMLACLVCGTTYITGRHLTQS